jgi:hypothetical protein
MISFMLQRLYQRDRVLISIGKEVGSRTGLNALEKRKIYCSCLDSNPDPSADHPIPHRYTELRWAA